MNEYSVKIKGEFMDDDGLRVEIKTVPNDFWGNLQSGRCPDCGGEWIWHEAGNVPGTRKCHDCGSYFTVLGHRYEYDGGISARERGVAILRRERFYS